MPDIVEFWGMTTPGTVTPQDFVAFDGAFVESKIEDNPVSPIYGHMTDGFGTSTLITEEKGLEVETYKQTWLVMAKGLTDANAVTGLATCRLCLDSIAAVLAYRNSGLVLDGTNGGAGTVYTGPNGSFPGQKRGLESKQNRFHNKTITLAPVAESLLAFKLSAFYVGADATQCNLLITQLADCSYWVLADPDGDCQAFFDRIGNYNQALSVIHFLQVAGILHADPDLTAEAQRLLQRVFDEGIQQVITPLSNVGVIYESVNKDTIGFDGSYMGFSLQSLAQIYLLLDAGTWKDEVEAQMLTCIPRWLETINTTTGVITDTPLDLQGDPRPWTRTYENTPRIPTLAPHGWSWDNFSYRALLLNYCFGNTVIPDTLPDLITEEGRNFGHVAGDPIDNPLLYIILEDADITAVEGLSATVDWAALGRVERAGGGACAGYPGGTLPDPVYIIPISVLFQAEHAEHEAALSALPTLDILEPGFPAAI